MNTNLRCFTFAVLASPLLCLGQATISTAAGTGTGGFSGDGGPATSARISGGFTVATDSAGNLYISDQGNNRIRKVNAAGVITTVAGGGSGGDGGPATSAQVYPSSVAVDAAGNLYIAQGASIRKVNTSGMISTIAGGSLPGFSGDGGPATSAQIFATNATVDAAGNVYIAEGINQRIRKIDTSGIIRTIAGTGVQGHSGDGGPATSAQLALPQGPAVDSAGNVYFAEVGRVRKIDTNGIITTVAGNGNGVVSGDGGPAVNAGMTPTWVSVDSAGNLYIADTGNNRIRKVNTAGIISTFAGGALNTGTGIGDGGPATSAVLSNPVSVAVDPSGIVYIADEFHIRVRKVSSGASGSPIMVNPSSLSFSYTIGADTPPSQTAVIIAPGATLTFTASASTTSGGNWLSVSPTSGNVDTTLTISVSPQGLPAGTYNGTVTLTPSGTGNTPQTIPVLLTVNAPVTQGVISTVAGNGFIPFQGEGGAATSAGLGTSALALDNGGDIFIGDTVSNEVLKVNPAGVITTFAGNGSYTFAGDGGAATSASVFGPNGVAADNSGNVYIADTTNNRIRKVDASGTITTVLGTGSPVSSGDGGPATNASAANPLAVAVDGAGNVYFTDTFRVRKINSAGIVNTVAGQFLPGFAGDGGPATSASFLLIGGITVDASGNLYIADVGNNRVRRVNPAGIVGTVAGNGTKGYSGDGGPATSAAFNLSGAHLGLAVDAVGNLYIPDAGNNRIRRVDPSGVVSTVAGNGIAGFSGDGGPATNAGLNQPTDVAADSAGNLYISDNKNNRIRKVTFAAASGGPVISANGVVNGASYQPGFSPSAWTTIVGRNLSSTTLTWDNFIVDGKLPTSLGGVSVSIGGQPAYLYFVSPTQINLIAPPVTPGSVQALVRNSGGTSSTVTATASQYAPAFFPWPLNQVVATRQDFSLAAKDGTFAPTTTVPAKPGDVIILFGSGFGPTSPSAPTGVELPADRSYPTATLPTVTVNGLQATVFGAALAPGYASLYQIAIQVPASLGDGDWPIQATIGGVSSPVGPVLSVKQ